MIASQQPPLRLGLCSVTYRQLSASDVARHAARAGLEVIEWGADRHAPPAAPEELERIAAMMVSMDLATCSYGSYHEAGVDHWSEFAPLASAAETLGTSRIRVWAGNKASHETDARERQDVVTGVRRAADVAADHGQTLALEFHAGTVTDSPESTLRLLDEVARDNVGVYWQAPLGMPDSDALGGLNALVEHVTAVHVFSWWPGEQRRPLTFRTGLWNAVFEVLSSQERPFDALIEFVPEDDPDLLVDEARALAAFAGRA